MKKTLSVLLATAIAGSIVLSGGCSKSPSAGDTSSEDTSKPLTISITWWGSQTRHDYTQKLLDTYKQKHPNVTFQATPAGWDGYSNKLSTQAAGNNLPDILQTDYAFIATFADNNTLADLSSYVKDKTVDTSDWNQDLVESGRLNGKLVGIPLSLNVQTFAYNPDIFKKAGVAEPTSEWNWDDFTSAMIQIKQKANVYGITELTATPVTGTFAYYLRSFGKTLYSKDGSKLGYTDDKLFIDYVNMLKKLQDAGAMPNADQQTQITAKGKEARPVVTGNAAMISEWCNYPLIVEKANPNLQLAMPPNASASTKPMFNKPSMFFSVSRNSKNKKASAEFINWFCNDIDANKVINAERGVPVSSKVRDALEPTLSPAGKRMFDYVDKVSKVTSKVDPPDPSGSSEVTDTLANAFNMVLYGNQSAQQAASEFRTKANDILAKNATS